MMAGSNWTSNKAHGDERAPSTGANCQQIRPISEDETAAVTSETSIEDDS